MRGYDAGGGRVSIAGVMCDRPGDHPHLYYSLRTYRLHYEFNLVRPAVHFAGTAGNVAPSNSASGQGRRASLSCPDNAHRTAQEP
jgi:hypothetical protein